MKLRDLKSVVDQAVATAGDTNPDVEVWVDDKMYRIESARQFNICPDFVLTLKTEPDAIIDNATAQLLSEDADPCLLNNLKPVDGT